MNGSFPSYYHSTEAHHRLRKVFLLMIPLDSKTIPSVIDREPRQHKSVAKCSIDVRFDGIVESIIPFTIIIIALHRSRESIELSRQRTHVLDRGWCTVEYLLRQILCSKDWIQASSSSIMESIQLSRIVIGTRNQFFVRNS